MFYPIKHLPPKSKQFEELFESDALARLDAIRYDDEEVSNNAN